MSIIYMKFAMGGNLYQQIPEFWFVLGDAELITPITCGLF